MLRLDHVYVMCPPGAPSQRALTARGLSVGASRAHPGQGTRNVCFGFANAYLELLWVEDDAATRGPVAAPLRLGDRARWRQHGGSPFGVCLSSEAAPPFPHWHYRPPYLPAHIDLFVATNCSDLAEPTLFSITRPYVPLAAAHALATRRLTRAALTTPTLAGSSPLRGLDVAGLEVAAGDEHLLELEFADATGEVLDLRPELPVVLRW